MAQMNELGFYALPGAPESPRQLIDEVHEAEAMGIGACFISERFNIKEAATLSGAAGAVSDTIGIATAATNHNTRHPMVTAAYAMTMHELTGGRFSLGLGRGIKRRDQAYGLTPITTAQMEDFVGVMRKVWAGEMVLGHDGVAALGLFCPFRTVVGLPCPVCGITRVVMLFGRGEIVSAFVLAPLPALLISALSIRSVLAVWSLARRRPVRLPRARPLIWWICVALLWSYAIWRSWLTGAP